jgi:hypothetical protein
MPAALHAYLDTFGDSNPGDGAAAGQLVERLNARELCSRRQASG